MKKFNITNILNNLKKHWWAYLLVCAVSVSISVYTVDTINKPRNEQTITVFVASYGTNEEFNKKLWNISPSYLRELQVRNFSFEDKDYSTYFDALGKKIADVIVLPKSKLASDTILDYYACFDEEIISTYFSKREVYEFTYNKKSYKSGICIHHKGDDSDGTITYKTSEANDQDYYAFVRKDSIHAGKLSNSKFDTALKYLQVL